MAKRFDNKAVLITGAAGGIGRASALAFGAEGARLIVVDHNAPACLVTAEMLREAGVDVEILTEDVTAVGAAGRMVAAAVQRYGRLDIAFNNCGITGPNVDICDYGDDDWSRVMEVNVNSAFRAMKAQIAQMRIQGGGVIVNTASVASQVAMPWSSGYVAAKHALLGLTRAAALDAIADGIRINAVCPGAIDTPMLEAGKSVPGLLEGIIAGQPIGRLGYPEEVARCVLFLASEDASLMVGHGMMVDGGTTIR